MRTILLTNGLHTLVDDEDYNFLDQWKWHGLPTKSGAYVVRYENKKAILMHRAVLGLRDGQECDHINRNTLDNRKQNLRACSHSQNMQNRAKHVRSDLKSHSVFKGVYFEEFRTKGDHKEIRPSPWCAQVTVNGRKVRRYKPTEVLAARAYDGLASQYFGEFAVLNFPANETL